MQISSATWNVMSRLLDEALDLEPAARAAWLEELTVTQPQLAPSVRKLLEAHAASDTADVMARLPSLPAAHVSALTPGDRVGPYRLLRELGSGGMADVWLAERADGAFTREVALKLPLINRLRRDLAQRFARERDILARLEHPQIARLYDAGVTTDGLPYLAMEYVDGQPITAYCDQHKLDIPTRLKLFGQVLDAVQFAHASLIIHRDLKPSNILVTADGQVGLLDFGIAKLLAEDDTAKETQLTQLSGRALTPDYASPEQIRGEPLTIATDVYSLGVVLYELLAGARPYKLKVNSAAQLEQAIVEAEPPRMSGAITAEAARLRTATSSQLGRALRGDLDTIVLKTLAKSPAQRYRTVAAFADDLQRERDGRPVFAQPASLSYRTKKFLVRNRIAVGVTSLFAVVLVAATVVSLWQAQLARAQAARADEVKRFVLSIFENADTGAGGSRKTTAVDLLQQARARLAAAGVTDTATYTELLTSIGVSLMSLGEYRDAEVVLEEAVRAAEPVLGGEHPNTLAAQLAFGQILETNGKLDRAQSMLTAAETGMRRSANVAGLANALQTQALLANMQRDYDTAIARAAEAVELAESLPATEARTKMLANSALATSRISGLRPGRLQPAQRAYELAKQTYGDRVNANLLALRSLYATALVQEGDPELGLAELKELMREQIELLGPDHHDVARTLQRIAQNALLLGDPHTAIESFTELTRFYPAVADGRPTADVGTLHSNLGLAYMIARQDSRAETELRRSIAILAEAQGKDYAGTRLSRSALAQTMVRQGRYADAESTLAELMAGPPPTQTDEAVNKSRLGMLRSAQKRHDEAIALLEQALEFHVQTRSQANIASATLGLGSALLEAGRAQEALEKLETVVSVYERRHPRGSPGRADATMQLGRAQLAVGRASAAAETLQKSAAYFIGFDATNRHTAVSRLWLARAYAASGDSRRAGEELREARAILAKSSVPPDHVLLAETQRLVERTAAQR